MPAGRISYREHTRGPVTKDGLALLARALVRKGGGVERRDLEREAEMRRIEEEVRRKNGERRG